LTEVFIVRFSKRAMLALIVLTLCGCGFHLRGQVELPERAKVVYLEGVDRGQPFSQQLTELLGFAGGRVTNDRNEAGSVLHVLRSLQERRQISLSRAGKANAFDLIYRIDYEAVTPKGEVLIPRQELEITRQYFVDLRFALGQGEQESQLRTEMEQEAAQALLLRLRYAVKDASLAKT
jgi:LPS-assembly lipoprotein